VRSTFFEGADPCVVELGPVVVVQCNGFANTREYIKAPQDDLDHCSNNSHRRDGEEGSKFMRENACNAFWTEEMIQDDVMVGGVVEVRIVLDVTFEYQMTIWQMILLTPRESLPVCTYPFVSKISVTALLINALISSGVIVIFSSGVGTRCHKCIAL
jgi:hypothetical protein